VSYSRAHKQRKQAEAWLTEHTRRGTKCAECGTVFTVDRGDGKRLAFFPNGLPHGVALYVLCKPCGAKYEKFGLAGIPEVQKDCKVTVAMSPYNPANRDASRSIH
jgi:hypothetical protein